MANPSDFEQEMLELINRARANPQGEFDALIANQASMQGVDNDITNAIRYFSVNLALFKEQMETFSPVAPLAWSSALNTAALSHSNLMISFDTQAHYLPGELGLVDRFGNAGYKQLRWAGENIFAYTDSPIQGHAGFMIDWGNGPGGMQDPAGHRISILNEKYTEVGIASVREDNASTRVGPYVVTQDFGTRADYQPQLLGVVFDDQDSDQFYDQGEGLSGVSISVVGAGGSYQTTSWSSGGYQLQVPQGSYTVTFSGEGLGGAQTKTVQIGDENVKLDAIAQESPNLDLSGDNIFISSSLNDSFNGESGLDTVIFQSSFANATVRVSGSNTSVYSALDGNDTLMEIERLQFSDGTLAVDVDGAAGEVYRLYQAAFARTPDTEGLSHNIELMDGGLTLNQIANAFLGSAEFLQRYGANLDNEAYINALYNNVLGRGAEEKGLNDWLDLMAGSNGHEALSRAQVLTGFSNSIENVNLVAATIDDGIWLG